MRPGDGLLEVETDKAAVTVEAGATGILRAIAYGEGEVAPIGEVLAYITPPGEDLGNTPRAAPRMDPAVAPAAVESPLDTAGASTATLPPPATRVLATPIARRLAQQHGIDLSRVEGTGPGGRIVEADIIRERERPAAPASEEIDYRDEELTRLERITGERLSEAQHSVPQFVLEADVDMAALAALRARLKAEQAYCPSFTALIGRAVALALREHPAVNSAYVDGKRRLFTRVNLGIATAIPNGLMVPVIREADRLSLAEMDSRVRGLAPRAQEGTLRVDEIVDGTFTLSNLGMYGVDAFQAIINPPQAAILAVGRVREAVVAKEGLIGVRPVATMRLTIDHRVLDGAVAAQFLARVRTILEVADALV